jgi:predicted dehydrogenase/threonine dehydrogenase-like Zn-dependent dehydrogenase
MRQIVLHSGQIQLMDLTAPTPAAGRVLIGNAASVISSGTERAVAATAGEGAPMRALRNPALVRKALEHMREHGVGDTLALARGVSARDTALGYSCAGIVLDTGGTSDLRVGQRVACAGANYASHAEIVSVPANLVASVPDSVSLRDAAFTTLGAIALQGVRRSNPTLGERIVVVGLGLLGLLAVQLLHAGGARVAGVEPDAKRRQLASELGAELVLTPRDTANAIDAWSDRVGADAVLITASSSSSAIVNGASRMLRHKGRIVLVGDVGLEFERGPLYMHEADVLISTSYGPGRYDPSYEENGIDYPLGYIRWTENRNMGEFLRLLGSGQVRVDPLVDMEVPIERAAEAYAAIEGSEPPLAAVLVYDTDPAAVTGAAQRGRAANSSATNSNNMVTKIHGSSELCVALIGAGGFVMGVHLPNLLADSRVRVKTVVTRSTTTAGDAARLAQGAAPTTVWRVPLADPDIDLVVIGTRHDSHAEIAVAALEAGKAVFVEKPLGLTREEIDTVWNASRNNGRLAIGFNRPFARLARCLHAEATATHGPMHVIYRVNSRLPPEHWLNDPLTGGGRLLGEACHMFDFVNWLCGTPERVLAAALPAPAALRTVESSSVTIVYSDGSVGTIHYSGVGAEELPKERIEVMRGGRAWTLDDFRSLTSYGPNGKRIKRQRRADKGHATLLAGVLTACRGEAPFTPGIDAAYKAQSVALAAIDSIAAGTAITVAQQPDSGDRDPTPEYFTS